MNFPVSVTSDWNLDCDTSRIHLMDLNRFHQIFKEWIFEKSRWQQSYLTELINNDLNYRDDYEQRLAQRKQFFNPENGDAPSMQSLEDSSRITNMGLLVKASIVLTFTGYTLSKALKLTPINPKTKIWRQIVQYTCCVHQIVLNVKTKQNKKQFHLLT